MEAKPTLYNGRMMRSRLEARFAAWLDEWGIEWSYEPGVLCCGEDCYLPDFLIDMPFEGGIWVEVKPTMELALAARGKVKRTLCSFPEVGIMLVVPHGRSSFCIACEYNPVTGRWTRKVRSFLDRKWSRV